MLLEGRKIFITGGYQGIGKACALACLNEGAKVTILDYVEQEKLDVLKEELGENCFVIHGDVTNSKSVKECVEYAVEVMGGLDGAINNAGSSAPGRIMDLKDEEFDFSIKLCLYGTFYCMREEAKKMKANGGAIVNMSSLNASFTAEAACGYNSAKAGIDALTKTAALELGQFGVRVNSIRPGFTLTETLSQAVAIPGYSEIVLPKVPLNRYGKPENIANLAVFLLSTKADYITGAIHTIDGGMETTGYPKVQALIDELIAQMASQNTN